MKTAEARSRPYFSERLIAWIDGIGARLGRKSALPEHLVVGRAGEEAAMFHLRRMGYTIVASDWRSARLRGDIDLIGWHEGTLCFIEVKTRSQRNIVPAAFSIDDGKRNMLRRMARAWVKHCAWAEKEPKRFDVVSVYLNGASPEIEVQRNAFAWHKPEN